MSPHHTTALAAALAAALALVAGSAAAADAGTDTATKPSRFAQDPYPSTYRPIAAIRGEGTSNDYLPAEVPALPAFALQRAVSTMVRDLGHDYWTGTVYTTNRRVWEHDDAFKRYLRTLRCMAIDMETATIFAAGFANRIPCGALLLVSDQPMIPEGVKTEASDARVSSEFVDRHVQIGIEALKLIRRGGKSVRHLRFDE